MSWRLPAGRQVEGDSSPPRLRRADVSELARPADVGDVPVVPVALAGAVGVAGHRVRHGGSPLRCDLLPAVISASEGTSAWRAGGLAKSLRMPMGHSWRSRQTFAFQTSATTSSTLRRGS
jgi:hypothetical protein